MDAETTKQLADYVTNRALRMALRMASENLALLADQIRSSRNVTRAEILSMIELMRGELARQMPEKMEVPE